MQYGTALEADRSAAEIFKPPRRVKPCAAASEVLRTEKGPWIPGMVPYMAEPLDMLGSRQYRGVVFVGPARTGKTMALILGGICYIVTCAPGDMLVVQMTQDAARDFSKTDLDRAIRHSPELASRMSTRARDDNTFDKFFRSGIMLKLGWPAVSQLSSKTLQYVFLTDYDRVENVDNIDGEGPMWNLAMKRTETYMSRGKTFAESSPGKTPEPEVTRWIPRTPHEAPPTKGILSLYNAGTRAMRYLPCQSCGEFFLAKPSIEAFNVPEFEEVCEEVQKHDLMTLAESWFRVPCKQCGTLHESIQRGDLTAGGFWVHEGERIVDGKIEGERRRSDTASYWLSGIEAAYQTWTGIGLAYLQGVLTYVQTSDEGPLRKSTNTDLGAPYIPRAMLNRRNSDELVSRVEDWERGTVPDGVRFLTAAVDVQAHRFVVHVMGWGVGLESWLIDRFSITASNRREGDRFAGLEPAAYVEDWSVLEDQVITRKYRAGDVELTPLLVMCDSGGKEGVTHNAYEFWRLMRAKQLGRRFRLVKGVGNLNAPRVNETYPDARARKDRSAGRGDVPVYMLNVNQIKDGVFGDIAREVPGPGYVHLPEWVDNDYFAEMTAERRTAKGWVRDGHAANEAPDLHTYNRAACIVLKAEAIDWNNPPAWAIEPERRESVARAQAQQIENASNRPSWAGRRNGWMKR